MAATLTGARRPERILRLGMLGEKRYFEDESLYDLVMLSANLVQGFTAGCAGFLATHPDRGFLIDPMTHAFAHDVKYVCRKRDGRLELKPTLQDLAASYGEPFASNAGVRPLVPRHFTTSDQAITDVCAAVLRFQEHVGLTQEDEKYVEPRNSRPIACIAPYFYMQPVTLDAWLPVNRALAEDFVVRAESAGTEALVMICIHEDLLEEREVPRWVGTYADMGASGYCLWVADSYESQLGPRELQGLREACARLSGNGQRPLYKVYGGYLGALLWHQGVSGLVFGPGYGEERDVVPVGGGLPQPKYYLPPLHQRLDAADVQRIVPATAGEFHERICNCEKCRELVGEDPSGDFARHYMETDITEVRRKDGASFEQAYATQTTRENSTWHYLHVRSAEVDVVAGHGPPDLAETMSRAAEEYETEFGLDGVAHLRAWAGAITET